MVKKLNNIFVKILKSFDMKTIVFTTVFLAIILVMTSLSEFNFTFINIIFLLGNIMIVLMVYKVLKEVYFTSKKFDNWYQDRPKTN